MKVLISTQFALETSSILEKQNFPALPHPMVVFQGRALGQGQADGFIGATKHLMDGVHLGALAGEAAASNLDVDQFGIILPFR